MPDLKTSRLVSITDLVARAKLCQASASVTCRSWLRLVKVICPWSSLAEVKQLG